MKNLFISYYESKSLERTEEIRKVIQFNIDSGWFDRVYLLLDPGVKNPFKGKVNEVILDKKPTFEYYFSIVNKYTSDEDLNAVSNSDIVFDETIEIAEKRIMKNECYALSRWELNSDMTMQHKQVQIYGDSQDVWIFKGPIKPIGYADFPMGKMGCDNRICHEIKVAGYKVLNPAKTIKTWHLHTVNFREYDNQERNEKTVVQPPYLTVPITEL